MPVTSRWLFGWMLLLVTGTVLLAACAPQRGETPDVTGQTPVAFASPTPTVPPRYTVDVPELGLRLAVPRELQTWKIVRPDGYAEVYLVPFDQEEDQEAEDLDDILESQTQERVLEVNLEETDFDLPIPPDPPFFMVDAYFLPEGRGWDSREVYLAFNQIAPPGVEDLEFGSTPTTLRTPRATGWTLTGRVQLTGSETVYPFRLTVLQTPIPRWIMAVWGVASEEQWPLWDRLYQEILLYTTFFEPQPRPTATPDIDEAEE